MSRMNWDKVRRQARLEAWEIDNPGEAFYLRKARQDGLGSDPLENRSPDYTPLPAPNKGGGTTDGKPQAAKAKKPAGGKPATPTPAKPNEPNAYSKLDPKLKRLVDTALDVISEKISLNQAACNLKLPEAQLLKFCNSLRTQVLQMGTALLRKNPNACK